MRNALLILIALALAACDHTVIENPDETTNVNSAGTEGDLFFVKKDGHTFAVFVTDHGSAAMVEVKPE